MARTLEVDNHLSTQHPLLMVPAVYSFSVVLYHNGVLPVWPTEAIRDAIVAALPPGTGVSDISSTCHGVYCGQQGAAK